MEVIKDYFSNQLNLQLFGRFGGFECLNMDAVIKNSLEKLKNIQLKKAKHYCEIVKTMVPQVTYA